jgi:hypothetical protein
MRGEPTEHEMSEPLSTESERPLRVGERVSLRGRAGVLRFLYGTGAAVVHFDREPGTRVVPLRRLVACTDQPPLPDR